MYCDIDCSALHIFCRILIKFCVHTSQWPISRSRQKCLSKKGTQVCILETLRAFVCSSMEFSMIRWIKYTRMQCVRQVVSKLQYINIVYIQIMVFLFYQTNAFQPDLLAFKQYHQHLSKPQDAACPQTHILHI
jgi:hypothetical protein